MWHVFSINNPPQIKNINKGFGSNSSITIYGVLERWFLSVERSTAPPITSRMSVTLSESMTRVSSRTPERRIIFNYLRHRMMPAPIVSQQNPSQQKRVSRKWRLLIRVRTHFSALSTAMPDFGDFRTLEEEMEPIEQRIYYN
ncbi:hypothetical protein Zmor_021248 [Zophobas morio]|uniref:Uncharacterized protein n=1 Tax=Zophobas morio TaxID=2755281 RepID=A0AA38MAI7_9CUCU|nr:hypothetical protein Zmor_021248 [Zophobas morio]